MDEDPPLSKFDGRAFLRVSAPLPLEFKSVDGAEAGTIAGMASRFGEVDLQGDTIRAGAFRRTLAEHKSLGTTPALLWSHNPAEVVGKWTAIAENGMGLAVEGRLNLATEPGRRAYEHVRAGDCRGLSIGFCLREGGYERRDKGGLTLTDIDLFEISITAMPAQRTAGITAVKSHVASISELEERLRAVLPGRAARKVASGGWPALNGGDDEPDPEIDALAKSIDRAVRRLRKGM